MKTPVAVIYKATWPEEKKIYGTLENITKKLKRQILRKRR